MIYDRNDGLAAIMFPVKEMKVFADTGPGCLARAPAYKAIVNAGSGDVVSIVGSRYQVLRNRQALDLARIACVSAFPDQPEELLPAMQSCTDMAAEKCTLLGSPRSGRSAPFARAPEKCAFFDGQKCALFGGH